MAYSNWGALVYNGDTRRADREDVAAFDDDGHDEHGQPIPSSARIYANIAKNRDRYGWNQAPAHAQCYHAVLGDGPVRLACYKTTPLLFDRGDDGQVHGFHLADLVTIGEPDPSEELYEGSYKGYRFHTHRIDNMIDLEWVEPGGRRWHARSGYLYGAGHTDVDTH